MEENLKLYAITHSQKFHVDSFRYGCGVYRHRRTFQCSDPVCLMKWDGFTFAQYTKWEWYFRYRAALAQIEDPHYLIEIRKWNYPHVDPIEVQLLRLQNKLPNAKAKVTSIAGKMNLAKINWTGMFSIEQEPEWLRALEKLEKAKAEVQKIEEEIEFLKAQSP